MLRIREMVNLTDLKRTLETGECDIVIIPADFLGGAFICFRSAEPSSQLAKPSDWKNIRHMKNNFSIRVWANRFPCQPQFFARKTTLEVVEQIKSVLNKGGNF